MSFPISVGIDGYAGWKVLQRVEERQKEQLTRDRIVQRDMNYFRDRIELTNTAEELVGDYKMLTIALGAFGLEDEINNRALIKKVLESDLNDKKSLANRFADKRFLKLAEAFDFHNRNKPQDEADDIFKLRAGLENFDSAAESEPEAILIANNKVRNDVDRAYNVIKKLTTRYSDDIKSMRDGGWKEQDIRKYSSTLDNILWRDFLTDAKDDKDPSAYNALKVFKNALGINYDFENNRLFDSLEVYDQMEKLSEASSKLFGSMSFGEIGKPENLARLAWAYVYNTQAIPAEADPASVTVVDRALPLSVDQKILDKAFTQRVGHGLLTKLSPDQSPNKTSPLWSEHMQARSFKARLSIINLAEANENDGKLWLKAANEPALGGVIRAAFRLDNGFDQLSEGEKLAELKKTSMRIAGTESFKDFAQPWFHERLIATFVFNDHNSTASSKKSPESDKAAPIATQEERDEMFVQRVGLGAIDDSAKNLSLEARDEFIRIAKSGSSDRAPLSEMINDRLWLEAVNNPTLGDVIRKTLWLSQDFDNLSEDRKLVELKEASKRMFLTESFGAYARPDVHENLIATFHFNERYSSLKALDPSDIDDGTGKPITQAVVDKIFIQRVGLGAADEIVQKLSISARNELVKIAALGDDNDKLWLDALNQTSLGEVIKAAFKLDESFDSLPDDEKLTKIHEISNSMLGTVLLKDYAHPDIHEHLIAEFAIETALPRPVTQDSLDKMFIQRVGLGAITEKTQKLSLKARDEVIKLVKSNDDEAKLWLDALDHPTLGSVVRTAFDLDQSFDQLSNANDLVRSEKLVELKEISNRLIGTASIKDYALPYFHERLIATHIFNSRNSMLETVQSVEPKLADRVEEAYLAREFERRVGFGDQNMRLALNARRELSVFAERDSSDRTLWYEILGNPPLRKVFEGAFGFGQDYGRLDVDRQFREFSRAAERTLGSSSFKEIGKPETIEKLLRNFFIRAEIGVASTGNRYSTALAIMSHPSPFG